MPRRPICLSACLLLLLLVSGCSLFSSVTNSVVDRDHDWSQVTLTDSDFDIEAMQRLDEQLDAGEYPQVHMVLIEQNARLVFEKYLSGNDENWGTSIGYRNFDADSLHDLRSISKSVTALLLGIALGDDFEAALERPILEYFPEFAADAAAGAEQVTLHQVLTMTAGFEWNEMEIPYSSLSNDARRMHYAADPVRYALTKPLTSKPGERWYYNGGMTLVLAALVEQISGQPFLEFARDRLALPLGVEKTQAQWREMGIWVERPTLPSASSGLRTTARSLAKVGALVMDQGRWRGQQIVPREWIEFSTRRHTEQSFALWSLDGIYGYGYQWWLGNFHGAYGNFRAIVGVGYGGQRLFIVPDKDLVVTVLAGNYSPEWVSERLLADIIAAMR